MMNISHLRLALLFLTSVLLSGCTMISPKVYSIGLRETFGDLPGNTPTSGKIELFDTPLHSEGIHFPSEAYRSYIFLKIDPHPITLGQFPYEIIEPPSPTSAMVGKARVFINGKARAFQVMEALERRNNPQFSFDQNWSYHLRHQYRQWYGYPAQVLQLAAIPMDNVIIPSGVVIYYILSIGDAVAVKPIIKALSHPPANAKAA